MGDDKMEEILIRMLISASPVVLIFARNLSSIIFYKKMILKKQSEYDGNIIKKAPFINNCKIEELKKSINNQKIELLLPIIKKLQEYTIEENLKTAYRNLQTVSVKEMSFMYCLLHSVAGVYDPEYNMITFIDSSIIGHEFLHMCSTYFDSENKESYSGFRQSNLEYSIGEALNEGYTELLASRIYNKNNKVNAYSSEVRIAKLFELFFDNPKDMEKFYFNHDLPGFIHYMEQFATKQEIIDIILKLDNTLFLRQNIDFPVSYRYIGIQLKLYNWYSSKIKDEVKLQQFRDLICENKIISMILNKQNMKLTKCNFRTDDVLAANSKIDKSK